MDGTPGDMVSIGGGGFMVGLGDLQCLTQPALILHTRGFGMHNLVSS